MNNILPVSYTHLDVYKRQTYQYAQRNSDDDSKSHRNYCHHYMFQQQLSYLREMLAHIIKQRYHHLTPLSLASPLI